jgi:hypothetical protein
MSAGRAGIGDLYSLDVSPWRQTVRLGANAASDLAHGNTSDKQGVCEERAMTSPWNALRAHQHNLLALREIDTALQTSSERCGPHIVGIPAKPGIAPSSVHRVRPGVSQSA